MPIDSCEYARQRHRVLLQWRNLWTILLFVFGSCVVLSLVTIVLFVFLRQQYAEGLTTAIGGVVSGLAVSWVVARRNDARAEEEEAYRDVSEKCAQAQAPPGFASVPSPDELRTRYRLFGRWL
jgi:hypothetical protein